MAAIGEQIRLHREAQHISLSDLARRSGVSKSYLSQLETGARVNLGSLALRRIAEALTLSVDALLDHRPDEPPNTTCQHSWVFLRQEEHPVTTWGDRVHEWRIEDVYYCGRCLEYGRVHVRTEEPSGSDYGRRLVTWRMP